MTRLRRSSSNVAFTCEKKLIVLRSTRHFNHCEYFLFPICDLSWVTSYALFYVSSTFAVRTEPERDYHFFPKCMSYSVQVDFLQFRNPDNPFNPRPAGGHILPPPPFEYSRELANYVRYRYQIFSTLSDINLTPILIILSNSVEFFFF